MSKQALNNFFYELCETGKTYDKKKNIYFVKMKLGYVFSFYPFLMCSRQFLRYKSHHPSKCLYLVNVVLELEIEWKVPKPTKNVYIYFAIIFMKTILSKHIYRSIKLPTSTTTNRKRKNIFLFHKSKFKS